MSSLLQRLLVPKQAVSREEDCSFRPAVFSYAKLMLNTDPEAEVNRENVWRMNINDESVVCV